MELAGSARTDAALSFVAGIYQAVVRNWSRPPSARNDMQAELLVELIPTGEVVSVTLVASSGNTAFDRYRRSGGAQGAALPRCRTTSGSSKPRFRQFTLLFKPEDLLR